jgi:inorganic triphosphatase YgiF
VRIGEVLLDTSEIPLGKHEEPTRLRRIEVEASVGTAPTPDLRGFVDEMQFALDLSPTSISKYEAGLYATGLSPDGVADLGPTDVDSSMSVGEVAFAVLRRQFTEMRAHESGTRLGEDPEELHDMRVATRRMRAAMKVFEGTLPERAKWLREELRWVAGVLGEVRDLDVQIGRLDETSSPEAFHDLRKKGKRLRYALEFVSEVYGKPVRKLVKPLKTLQDDLGDHQDAIVAADQLRELGTTTGGTRISRGAAFTMGVYSERYAREATNLRSGVLRSKPFRALAKGKEWKAFEKAMKDARKSQDRVRSSGKAVR